MGGCQRVLVCMTSFSFLKDCLHILKILPNADRQAEQCGANLLVLEQRPPVTPFSPAWFSGCSFSAPVGSQRHCQVPSAGNIPILFFVMLVTVFFVFFFNLVFLERGCFVSFQTRTKFARILSRTPVYSSPRSTDC